MEQPVAIESRIEAVTVYRRGARVQRLARLTSEDGAPPATVAVEGLPMALDDSSVRVRVEPAGSVVAFDHRVTLDVPRHDPDVPVAEPEELDQARREVELADAQVAHIERELFRLGSLELVSRPSGAKGEPPAASPIEARLDLIQFRADMKRKLRADVRDARDRLDKAHRRLAELEERLARASDARQVRDHELRKAIVVSLRGDRLADHMLIVEYVVPGPRWAPVYTVRLDRDLARAHLAVRAMVAQKSGEDWTQARMTLSTAAVQSWVDLPELAGLRIGRRQAHIPRLGWRPPPLDTAELFGDWDRAFKLSAPPASEAPAPAAMRSGRATSPMEPPMHLDEDLDLGDHEEETQVDRLAPPGLARPGAAPSPQAFAVSAPPPAMAAPAPMMAAAPRSRAAPARKVRAEGAASAAGPGMTTLAGAVETAPAADDDIVAASELLRYGDLRLASARSHKRGRLRPAPTIERYLEADSRLSSLRTSAKRAVDRAMSEAEAAGDRVPPGCILAWSEVYDYAYPAEERVDVPSDGDYHSIPLIERECSCEARFVVVPRESADVFRKVSLTNPLDAPLLSGPVDIYQGDQFLITGRVTGTSARGHFELGLGVEQGIKVARNTRYREEVAGLMGGALRLHHQILVEIRNNLSRAATVEVRERVPVSAPGEEEIEIHASASPAWSEWQQDTHGPAERELRGGHLWRVDIPSGGRQDLRADYEIRISAKHELVGGNRREA